MLRFVLTWCLAGFLYVLLCSGGGVLLTVKAEHKSPLSWIALILFIAMALPAIAVIKGWTPKHWENRHITALMAAMFAGAMPSVIIISYL